jgi:hypothetical protein
MKGDYYSNLKSAMKEDRFNISYELEKERLQLDQVRGGIEQVRVAK